MRTVFADDELTSQVYEMPSRSLEMYMDMLVSDDSVGVVSNVLLA